MKLITAVIQPHAVHPVKGALALFGVGGLTLTEVVGNRPRQAHVEIYRGVRQWVDLLPRVQLDVIVPDADVPDLVRVIARAASGHDTDDTIVWVTPVDHLVRIRTGERGTDAT